MAKHIGSLSYCYTEDDILIYSICVLPPLRTSYKSKLLEYFTKFGDVENINMITKKNFMMRGNSTSAVVRFKNPKSASNALNHKPHRFCRRFIYVKSDLSCNQPYQTKLTTSDANDNPNNIYTILKLNDDCLLLIFQYLSLLDQYNLSTLCSRMENIYESSTNMMKSIRIVERDILNIHSFRIVLEKVGHNIQCITFCSSVENLNIEENLKLTLNYLLKLCPNLYQLKFDGVFLKYNDFSNFTSLRHIELKDACLEDDKTILKLTNLSNIKYLDLTSNNFITGLYLHKFHNLETLILNNCFYIKSENFIKICSSIKNLKELNINHCDKLNSNAIDALIDNLNVLEILTICMDLEDVNNYENIPKLKNLKHLTINEAYWNCISLLKQLVKGKAHQLETLKIGQFIYDDEKGFAIKQLKKLKQLDLPDASIENQFFNDLSNLHDLKILNIPWCDNIDQEIVLDYLNKAPITLEEIDLYHLQCDEEFALRASKILKLQNRSKALTLTLKCDKIKKKLFEEDNMVILKIRNTEKNYDYVKKFSKIKRRSTHNPGMWYCRHDDIARKLRIQRMERENGTN